MQKNGWLSVPEFGGWDKQAPASPNYSVVFSQARANRKHLKTDLSDLRSNLENERELINANHDHHQDDPVMVSLHFTESNLKNDLSFPDR